MKTSIFFITLNTNKSIKNYYEEEYVKSHFDDRINNLKDPDGYSNILYSKNGTPMDDVIISQSETEHAFEEGKKYKRLHCHLVWEITHNDMLHIDIQSMKEYFLQDLRRLGWDNMHIDVNAVSNRRKTLRSYISKDQF